MTITNDFFLPAACPSDTFCTCGFPNGFFSGRPRQPLLMMPFWFLYSRGWASWILIQA